MTNGELDVPVVLIIFNRPEHTRAVFDEIAAVRPGRLFVIADGPRPGRPEDARKCAASRAILDRLNWRCDVRTDFAETNLGCGRRIASGLDWVFDQVDRAIILEDDCLPDMSFFRFCAEILDKYQDDPRIRTITGSSFLRGKTRSRWSYYFSKFHCTWGWATWRRSWQDVDISMQNWPEVRDGGWLIDILGSRRKARFFASRFDRTYQGRLNSWTYPYQFSCWLGNGLAVTPNRNLISNVGSGEAATNVLPDAPFLHQRRDAMPFPLVHPPFVVVDRLSDDEMFRRRCLPEQGPWLRRAARRAYRLLTAKAGRSSNDPGRGRLAKRPALLVDP